MVRPIFQEIFPILLPLQPKKKKKKKKKIQVFKQVLYYLQPYQVQFCRNQLKCWKH